MVYILFVAGLLGLFFGGEFLVRGAANVARSYRISPMVIGLTIVGFGTSTPELLVSLNAALDGASSIAVGNVLGSNIANILLILGLTALIYPVAVDGRRVWKDLAFMVGATVLLWIMLLGDGLSRIEAGVLVAALIGFLVSSFLSGRTEEEETDPEALTPVWKSALITLGGLVVLMVGARLLVDSSTQIARSFGISEAVIGLTIVAVGTSLPELATSAIAAWRKHSEIAVGNVIGSNIFNVLGILGITGLVLPIQGLDPRFLREDMPWVLGCSLLLVLLAFALKGVPRWAGALLLAAYGGYVALML
ncbi:calcium/sodium antiporter [Rhodobacter sphaeroides]|uniref:Sodium/calcium exchanger n=1 Tax=Cereibacter sphaeroides (strain ATCC 17023 / DSM 158 / JCM 6121 / CCUG 31486 / LMG 2827 / NBRC 12203 / NCIMB 8253 / ATH 2.4.1.) TaxID=272943 RepID=Q3J341_CERS4|nr:calcium/sodium antiporter [Cereibacter sphaeroides]ABA78793.1 putative sodium/calcium exchanger [Cereibacter sphaeroides 2.4.1]AMJ47128.1 sodium:calcium antiporter [Cereibacter sphaeroides]ANS33842.1 sodium:calcium antiporter [Cereibacter sphaeroides]ATN62885.1 sodium:calcium antiporter [Cereibacter sphaeroides]AXC61004.1 sodium:calcium antiporter [Cereibacter sphaeroides 2.4.1]